jgi:hypothetical protein
LVSLHSFLVWAGAISLLRLKWRFFRRRLRKTVCES